VTFPHPHKRPRQRHSSQSVTPPPARQPPPLPPYTQAKLTDADHTKKILHEGYSDDGKSHTRARCIHRAKVGNTVVSCWEVAWQALRCRPLPGETDARDPDPAVPHEHGLLRLRDFVLSLSSLERARHIYPILASGVRRAVDPASGLPTGQLELHYIVPGTSIEVCRDVFLTIYPVASRTLTNMVQRALHPSQPKEYYDRDEIGSMRTPHATLAAQVAPQPSPPPSPAPFHPYAPC